MTPLIPTRKRTFGQKVGESFGVLFEIAFVGLMAWIAFRIVWFFI
jgi:hypothetical protein